MTGRASDAAKLEPLRTEGERRQRREATALRKLLTAQGATLTELRARLDALAVENAEKGALLEDALQQVQALAVSASTEKNAGTDEDPSKRKEYDRLVRRVHETVGALVPAGARVAVVSRGDTELLRLEGRSGCHFPQGEDGVYAGHHPVDSAAAIEHLDQLLRKEVQYLVFPATARWWLDHYREFKQHLDTRHDIVTDEVKTCVIYRLRPPTRSRRGAAHQPEESPDALRAVQLSELIRGLLPADAAVAVVTSPGEGPPELGGMTVFGMPAPTGATAGRAPLDDHEAMAELDAARARGAQYLVVPSSSAWLADVPEFAVHVERSYRLVTKQRHVCSIYDLAVQERVCPPSKRPQVSWLRRSVDA